jgi:hypothetical protein
MAKKKSSAKTKAKRKAPAKKKAAKKKAVPKKRAKKKTPAKKRPKKKAAKKKAAAKKKVAVKKKVPAKKSAATLGRPRIAGDVKLDQFFHRDYEVRQVFEFLRVTTVKELEEHRPDDIIEQLTAPVVQAVERIRKALAMNNRHLAGDKRFAVQFNKQIAKR